MKKILVFSLALITLFALQSCLKKDDVVELLESGEDQSLLENEFAVIFDNVDNTASTENAGGRIEAAEILPPCATVTYVAASRTLTIDFGTDYCLCKDGRSRKGKILSVFSGKHRQVGSSISTTLQDYYVKNLQGTEVKFEATKTITYTAKTNEGSTYSYTVSNAKAITPNGTISWQTNATIQRTKGDATVLNPWDDEYMVTATSSGINRRGMAFTVTTSQPLKKKIQAGCAANFVSGILVLTNSDNNKLTLDYDPDKNEACDKIATIQFNNRPPRRIILK